MELTAFKPNESTITSVIIAIVVVFVLMYIYHHYIDTQPVGSLTATQYGQLPAAAQANYTVSPTTGYYLVKGTPIV